MPKQRGQVKPLIMTVGVGEAGGIGGHPVGMASANGRDGPPPQLPQLPFELSASPAGLLALIPV